LGTFATAATAQKVSTRAHEASIYTPDRVRPIE